MDAEYLCNHHCSSVQQSLSPHPANWLLIHQHNITCVPVLYLSRVNPKPSFLLLCHAGAENFPTYSSPLPAGLGLCSAHRRQWGRYEGREGGRKAFSLFVCCPSNSTSPGDSSWVQPLFFSGTPRISLIGPPKMYQPPGRAMLLVKALGENPSLPLPSF